MFALLKNKIFKTIFILALTSKKILKNQIFSSLENSIVAIL